MDASQVLGSPQVAALIVVPKGFGASTLRTAANANLAGAVALPLVMKAGRRGRRAAPSDLVLATPRFSGYGLLALTAHELALVTGPRNREVKVIARRPRNEIVFAERSGRFPTSHLVIAFRNGQGWYFEVQWNRWRAAKKILPLLQAL